MISLMPTAGPTQTADAYALLAIIADPDAAKKRLDELVAEKQAALDMADKASQAQADAEKLRASVANQLAQVKSDADTFNASSAVRTRQLEDHEAVLSTRQQQIDGHEKSVTAWEANVKGRETAVTEREQFLTAREEAATKLAAESQVLKDTYEAKIAALQSAMAIAPAPASHVLPAESGSIGSTMSATK